MDDDGSFGERVAGVDRLAIPFRYVWPAELDLTAALAGLRPHERWGGWQREPFTSASDRHVPGWKKPATQAAWLRAQATD